MGTIIANTGYTPFEVVSTGGLGLQQELTRHLVNTFYAPIWAARDLPDWFKEGLTYVYYPGDQFHTTRDRRKRHNEHKRCEKVRPDQRK